MAQEKAGFEDFIGTVQEDCQPFVTELHRQLTDLGCTIEIKEAKSGYVVSYLLRKKTVLNYVFRKQGLIVRIYANQIADYMEFLDTLPAEVTKAIADAPVCKRLIDPASCNPKCAMGYDFMLNGERYKKCRNGAFMFPVTDETKTHVKAFVCSEVKARG